jgi:hypothetical protein
VSVNIIETNKIALKIFFQICSSSRKIQKIIENLLVALQVFSLNFDQWNSVIVFFKNKRDKNLFLCIFIQLICVYNYNMMNPLNISQNICWILGMRKWQSMNPQNVSHCQQTSVISLLPETNWFRKFSQISCSITKIISSSAIVQY